VFVIFLVGSGVRYGGADHTPALTTSCTTPGLAVSTSSTVRGHPLYFAVTGPDQSVVVAIDAANLSPDLSAVPLAGKTPQVIRPPLTIRGCKGKGVLGVQVGPGSHVIGVFPAEGGGPLTTQPLTVTDR
jgi:hypothetical protein